MPGVGATLKEFKAGTLRSGSKTGPKVTNPQQALAIGLSQERKAQRPKSPRGQRPTGRSAVRY